MPYKLKKSEKGYKVCKKDGDKCFSKKPLSKGKAKKQMKAIYANESFDDLVNKYLKDFLFEEIAPAPSAAEVQQTSQKIQQDKKKKAQLAAQDASKLPDPNKVKKLIQAQKDLDASQTGI